MSLNIFNRLIVSPGKQHRQITHFMNNELGILSMESFKSKEYLRIHFMTENPFASSKLSTLSKNFPHYNFDLIWFNEPCTYVKAVKVLENNAYPIAFLGWGLSDYLNDEKSSEQEIQIVDLDWTALEYDLLLGSHQGGFLENSKIIPEFTQFEGVDLLKSDRFAPETLSAKALVMNALSDGVDIQTIPTHYLSPELYSEAFQRQWISFEVLPESMLTEEFLEEICWRDGKKIFLKLRPKHLSEDVCLAAITAVKEPISLRDVPNKLRTELICEFALQQDIQQFRFIPKNILNQALCNQFPAALQFMPNDFKSLELCKSALRVSESNLAFVPKHFISKALVHKMAREAHQPDSFLEFVPTEFFTSRFVKVILKKNPQEFKFIPEEFKTFEITKRFVLRDIENLAFASVDFLDDLLKHRSIRKAFLKHIKSLSLLPRSYLSKEFVFEVFKDKGVQLDEIANHLLSESLILLAVRRSKKSVPDTINHQLHFQSIGMNCGKPKVWQFMPNKFKDYEFCKTAIAFAHPSVEADILLHLLENTPREIDAFNDSIQWLYYFIERRLSRHFRDEHLLQIDLSEHLEKTWDGSASGEEKLQTFVAYLIQDIVQTTKQLQAIQEIGAAAWRLWIELCAMVYPSTDQAEKKSSMSTQATRLFNSSKQMKILNLYLKIVDEWKTPESVQVQLSSKNFAD